MKGKQQDFRTEKYIRYGIRKYSFVISAPNLLQIFQRYFLCTCVKKTNTQ